METRNTKLNAELEEGAVQPSQEELLQSTSDEATDEPTGVPYIPPPKPVH